MTLDPNGYGATSFWLETSGDDLTPRPRFDGSGDTDVAILGAGYTGLWTAFELLRPNDDRNQFLVYTRWRSEEDFLAWVNSPAFAHGHKAHSSTGPVSSHAELWSFDVAQHERAASDS